MAIYVHSELEEQGWIGVTMERDKVQNHYEVKVLSSKFHL